MKTQKTKPCTKLEKEIEKEILSYLKSKGIFAWKNKSQGTFDPIRQQHRTNRSMLKGVSDILGILDDGRFLAIEVKSRRGVVTPEQKEFIKKINDHDGLAFVARCLEDVTKKFDTGCCVELDWCD